MASVNEPADLFAVAESPTGLQYIVGKYRSNGPVAAGFSPDGVLANTTFDKHMRQPVSGPVMTGGWYLHLFAALDATDGIDASDCIVLLPITESSGAERHISASDLGFTTDLPALTPAGYKVELGSGWLVPDGLRVRFGSVSGNTPIVIALEDDTA